ncbi:MAG: metal ABC transporter ATP-binding protein [Candidatus Hydrogenedentes bacterium]|nr:metal ABC transporter ATP-binding protein [Candidatus Hydrogenedentota bacterium]
MSAPAVSCQALGFQIGPHAILRDITFDLVAGEHLAIIGPNGAGKTTLIRMILGLEQPSTGRVEVYGGLPVKYPPQLLSYVPQRKYFEVEFPARVEEFVVSGLRRGWPWRVNRKERSLVALQLEVLGIERLQHQSLGSLSGGELQRVYLARALIRKPQLIVLDEPAAGMDIAAEGQLHHQLLAYQRESGATVVLITHDWEGARLHASQVLLLNKEIVAVGKPEFAAREELLLEVFGHTGHLRDSHKGHHHA